jgi:hypothetical protein
MVNQLLRCGLALRKSPPRELLVPLPGYFAQMSEVTPEFERTVGYLKLPHWLQRERPA